MTPEAAAQVLQAAYRHQRPWRADEIAATLATPGAQLFGRQDAVLIARILAGEAEILALATAPAAQRAGHAAALLAAFHAAARAGQADTAFLDVAAANTAARAFYARAGYRDAGRRPRYYRLPDGTRDDAIVMTRALPADGG
ncbi:GNAT family N-acetyltransferase [Roseivivax sp. CAU 1753]